MPNVPPLTLPPPLPDREGHISGVESITIDGKRWLFGFDYQSNLVVSPLIDDPDTMAAFASRYMMQTDGMHDAHYWMKIVLWAIDGVPGGLASPENANFSSSDFHRIAIELAAAQADNHALPGFAIDYHMLYLLAAAVGDRPPSVDATYASARQRIGLSDRDSRLYLACDAVDLLNGSTPLTNGATYADVATFLRLCLSDIVDNAPANWRAVFQELKGT